MKLWKKLACLGMAAVMALGLTGCLGNFYTKVLTVEGVEIEPGLYLMMQLRAYSEAEGLVEDENKDVLKQRVEGTSATSWIRRSTEETARRYVAVQNLARQYGVVLSDDSWSNIDSSAEYWAYLEDYYLENGVGYDNWLYYIENSYLDEDLFSHLYGEGGERQPGDEEAKARYGEVRVHVRYLSLPLTYAATADDFDEQDADEVEAKSREMAAAMLQKLESGQVTLEELAATDYKDMYDATGREYDEETDYIYSLYLNPDSDSYTEEFGAQLRSQSVGDFGLNDSSSLNLMLYEIIPLFESDEEFEENYDSILYTVYYEEYEAWLEEVYSAYSVQKTLGAQWYYSPKKIV